MQRAHPLRALRASTLSNDSEHNFILLHLRSATGGGGWDKPKSLNTDSEVGAMKGWAGAVVLASELAHYSLAKAVSLGRTSARSADFSSHKPPKRPRSLCVAVLLMKGQVPLRHGQLHT